VLDDDVLIALACRAPANRNELGSIADWPERLPADVADAVLAAVACGAGLPAEACPAPAERMGPSAGRALRAGTERLLEQVRRACAEFRIDPALVASRADIESCVQREAQSATPDHPLARGWRRELLAAVKIQ